MSVTYDMSMSVSDIKAAQPGDGEQLLTGGAGEHAVRRSGGKKAGVAISQALEANKTI